MCIAHSVFKLVNQKSYIALCYASTLALMRNKHNLLATQHLVVKESTADACKALYAKHKEVDVYVLIFYYLTRSKTLYLKEAVRGAFRTK